MRTRDLPASSLITTVARGVQIMYTSRGADPGLDPLVDGAETAVTGTILVPNQPWPGAGPRPVVGLAPGTHGQGQNCSVSKQIARNEEIQLGDALPLLTKGYAVAVSDYEGYTNGGTHPYTIGQVLGRNVLDAVRAARTVPGSGVTEESPVGLWGYSEGGAGASWAAQLAATYAPELNVAAVASGGTPTYLADNGRFLDGGLYVDFALNAATGLDAAYPSLDLADRQLNDAGHAAQRMNQQPDHCLTQTVLGHPFAQSSTFTRSGRPLDQLLADPDIARVVDAQTLGRIAFDAPTFLYWGDADDIVPASTQRKQFDMYCALGMHVQRQSVPVLNHILTQETMIPSVTDWLATTISTGVSRNDC
ncbi:lipase family protein [Rhodococcus sp. SORGH_AS_0301]|uniref:lipase family protein n=1 Tax=Rhodococcus sp. SORGH_AS_0301 TaxID=3041780 RepID=UPI0027D7EED7|nr:lipase family protein [Rhodococcus sp. SORGH_AS_0301]